MMGVAIGRENLGNEEYMELLLKEFNSFTCENDMKTAFFDEEKNKEEYKKYNLSPALTFQNAIPYPDFAKKNGI